MVLARLRDTSSPRGARAIATRLPGALALSVLTMVAVGIRPIALGIVAVALVTEELIRVDVAEHRLPNRLVLPLYPVIALSIGAEWAVSGATPVTAVLAGVGWFGFLLLLCVAGGMGMGDVKLGGALGLAIGALGLVPAVGGLVFAFVTGAVGGVVALFRARSDRLEPGRARRIPFGPFLLAGFWSAVVCFPFLDAVST